MTEYYIGIDAGGTHCRASLYDADGILLGKGKAGSANVFSHFQGAMQQIEEAISNAKIHSGLHIENTKLIVGAGCAGGQTTHAKECLEKWQHPYKQFFMTSDLHASCLAANKGKDCIVIIVGTGSSIAHYQHGKIRQYGGHGFVHGDDAGGAWLGLQAVQIVLKSLDNLIDDKAFCDRIFKLVHGKIVEGMARSGRHYNAERNADLLLRFFKQKSAADYAALAPSILELNNTGNKTAMALVGQGLTYLFEVLVANQLLQTSNIFMTGGLTPIYREALAEKARTRIDTIQQPAEYGAFLFGQSQAHHLRNISV